MNERFNQTEHVSEIHTIVDAVLGNYVQLLVDAGVPPEDVAAAASKASVAGYTSRRKAERFAALVNQITQST